VRLFFARRLVVDVKWSSHSEKLMSAFGYFGSKRRLAAKLQTWLPPHNAWVELFCGSAAMTLAKKPAQIEVINDINGEIVNFFHQLQHNTKKLKRLVYFTPYARAEYELAKKRGSDLTDLERARRFFVAAMMSINGAFGKDSGGFSFTNSYSRNGMEARVSRWQGMPKHIDWVAKRLKTVRIEQQDAIELFRKFQNRPGTLAYLDPPYLGKRSRSYDFDENTMEFHSKLLMNVVKAQCMTLISGYENELYDSMLSSKRGWKKEVVRTTTKGNNGKSFERQEVLWFNEPFQRALGSKKVLLRLNKHESSNGKVNPERV
jgi:DNA adenine methylase